MLAGLQAKTHGLLLCAEHGEMRTVVGGGVGEGRFRLGEQTKWQNRSQVDQWRAASLLGWNTGRGETGGHKVGLGALNNMTKSLAPQSFSAGFHLLSKNP